MSKEFHDMQLEMMEIAVKQDETNYEFINNILVSCDEYPYYGKRRYNKFHVIKCPLCKINFPKLLQLLTDNKIVL